MKGMELEMNLPYEWIKEILHLVAERMVVIDRQGVISYMDQAYCDFLGIKPEDAIGKSVRDVIENTRMDIILKTGQAELGAVQPIKGSEMVANRYPIFIDNELVGAVGTVLFRNPQEWMEYSRKIQPLLEELKYYKTEFEKELKSKYRFEDLVGKHPRFLEAKRLAERVSGSQSVVLLSGESGTGKELFAHAIHQTSPREQAPFVRVNCASIPEHLLESELFGYEEGAFTGAKKGGKKGKFELAHRGTIFLDEIGDMPLSMQSKLLRVLQEREIDRVGGQVPIQVDVRVIAASHRDLEKMVEEGKFRQDLFYRLHVMKIEIPALRDRREDIPFIAEVLLKKIEKKFYRQGIGLSRDVIQRLQEHQWPGNIRELENVLERAINVLDGKVIEMNHLPLYLHDHSIPERFIATKSKREHENVEEMIIPPLRDIVAKAEREAMIKALTQTNGNKIMAASLLKVGKTSFYDKCKLYQID